MPRSPVILPDSAELTLMVPTDARNSVRVSFDGRNCAVLERGDAVQVTMEWHWEGLHTLHAAGCYDWPGRAV